MLRKLILVLILILSSGLAANPALPGELTDHGPQGDMSQGVMFHDAGSGLYWIDPALFTPAAREVCDLFATGAPGWSYATGAQVEALLGSTAPSGLTLEDVMGPRLATAGGPRWVGFCDGSSPDGWLVQSTTPPYDTITEQSLQNNTGGLDHGAWLVAANDPVARPRLDGLTAADYPYFLDQETGLYWWDPVVFQGQSRAQVESWLAANSDWRWASAAEVLALMGKLTAGDVPLVEVLGPGTEEMGGGIVRWLGYYDQSTSPDGIILQSGSTANLPFIIIASYQANAQAFNPGAWLVSDVEPTAVEQTSLGGLKAMYRD